MAVILKYEIEEGGYYDVLDTDYIKPWQNYYDHVIGCEYRKPKTAEVEYEPTDEEYAQQLAWYGLQGLPREEQDKYREIAYRLAKAALEVLPELTEAIDKDEEFAVDLALEHKLEEFD